MVGTLFSFSLFWQIVMDNHIIYIGGFDLPDNNAAALRVIGNSKIFCKLGYSVSLIGLSRSISKPVSFKYEEFDCCNLPYPNSVMQWCKYLTSIRQYLPFLKQNKPKMVIAYNHPAIALQKLVDYCKKNGIKIISDCTEWYEPKGNPIFKLVKGWDVRKRMYDVHSQFDGIIAISRYLYEFYSKRNLKTLLIPPLVDIQEDKWKQTIGANDDTIRIIFSRAFSRGNKDGIDLVIEALEAVYKRNDINAFSLDVVGMNQADFARISSRQSSIPSFVHFHNHIPHQGLIQKLKQADFQIFIRNNSLANEAGFPTKFVESISSRTMVLTNQSSNLGDYMKEGDNSFCLNINTFEDLVESLSQPLRMSKKEIMERRSKMDVTTFDYRNYTTDMESFLSKIIC